MFQIKSQLPTFTLHSPPISFNQPNTSLTLLKIINNNKRCVDNIRVEIFQTLSVEHGSEGSDSYFGVYAMVLEV